MSKMNGIRRKPRPGKIGQGGCVYATGGGSGGPSFPWWVGVLLQELLGIRKRSRGEPETRICAVHILSWLTFYSTAKPYTL